MNPIYINKLDNQKQKEPSFIPQTSFQCMLIGSIGASKTTTLINLLKDPKAFAGRFNKIIIVSPTAHLDEKWKILYKYPIIVPNKRLIKKLLEEERKKKRKGKVCIGHMPNDTYFDDEIYNIENTKIRPIKDTDFVNGVDLSFLPELLKQQDKIITKFGKDYVDHVLIICDDCVSDPKTFRDPNVLGACLRSRHYEISTIYVTQCYYLIPKSVRLNCGWKIVYGMYNETELKDLYSENTCDMNFKEFLIKFHKIIEIPYAFASINYYNNKGFRLANCLHEFV